MDPSKFLDTLDELNETIVNCYRLPDDALRGDENARKYPNFVFLRLIAQPQEEIDRAQSQLNEQNDR